MAKLPATKDDIIQKPVIYHNQMNSLLGKEHERYPKLLLVLFVITIYADPDRLAQLFNNLWQTAYVILPHLAP